MPGFSRAVFLSLQAAALIATVGPSMAPLSVVAAPVPISHIADYASQPPARTNATLPQVQDLSTPSRSKDGTVVDHTPSDASSMARRQDLSGESLGGLEGLAAQLQALIAPLDLSNNPIAQAIVALLDAIHQAPALNDLGQEKGLKHFDENVALEVQLKNIVNNIKYSLSAISNFAYEVDPMLGQMVFLVKCIVDAVLDTLENATDGMINDGMMAELQEMLAELTEQANNLNCILGLICL